MHHDHEGPGRFAHVRVLAGTASSGQPVYEVLPAIAALRNRFEPYGNVYDDNGDPLGWWTTG